jgi:predicted ATPase
MKSESLRIENFPGFKDETIAFDTCTPFGGPKGLGKSTVFQTDLLKLSAKDFHHFNISLPTKVSVTFSSLSEKAKEDRRLCPARQINRNNNCQVRTWGSSEIVGLNISLSLIFKPSYSHINKHKALAAIFY